MLVQVFQQKKTNKLKQLFLLLLVGFLTFFSTYGLIQLFTTKIYASAESLIFPIDFNIKYDNEYLIDRFAEFESHEPYSSFSVPVSSYGKTYFLNNATTQKLFGAKSTNSQLISFGYINRASSSFVDIKLDYIGDGPEPSIELIDSMFGFSPYYKTTYFKLVGLLNDNELFSTNAIPFIQQLSSIVYLSDISVGYFRYYDSMFEYNQSLDKLIVSINLPMLENNFVDFFFENYDLNIYVIPYVELFNTIYNNGLNLGYDVGFIDGLDEASPELLIPELIENVEQDGYDNGFNEGFTDGYGGGLLDGYDNGFNEGFTDGYAGGLLDGYDSGWNVGYNEGYSIGVGDSDAGVKGLLLVPASILGTLFTTAFNWLNFTVLGINLWSLILIAASFAFVVLILKMFLGR